MYVPCSTCGRYFSIPREKTETDNKDGEQHQGSDEYKTRHCSPDCATDYTERYKGNFREALLKASGR